ncbi:MAG TPA: SGNH/GDSL hydrolase family protein [Thermoanaerobaculia bacterium]|jgi:hypothetical protein
MKPAVLRFATSLVATLVALGLAELVARRTYGEGFNVLVDPYEDHSYRPFLEYEQPWGEGKYRFYTNSLGWKDSRPDRVVQKRTALTRVVFLGDSFTEGLGYKQEKTLTGFTERDLNTGGRRWEVLNGGRVSYSPLLEYQRLKKFLAAGYHTDVVVVLHDVSDVEDELYYSSRYQFSETGEPLRFRGWNYHPFLRALYNHSALVRSVRRAASPPPGAPAPDRVREVPPDLRPGAGPISSRRLVELSDWAYRALRQNWTAHPPSLAGWAEEGLQSSFRNLLRIQRLTREHGVRFLIVIYPVPQMLYTSEDPRYYAVLKRTFPTWFTDREAFYGTRPSPRVSEYQRRMHRFCREHGIQLVDLIPEFQRVPEWHRLFIPGDVHFNERGNRLAGLRIAVALRKPTA